MNLKLILFSILLIPILGQSQEISPGIYFVTADVLNVRIAPDSKANITNKLYIQQKVYVYEVKNNWARISEYYDGNLEGVTGNIARWVSTDFLSNVQPTENLLPDLLIDPRIKGIPKVGQFGATEQDVNILITAAKYFLESKKCSNIEYGDKSTNKPNTYYLNCGGSVNHFFTPSEIPGL